MKRISNMPYATEMVWDGGESATGLSASGKALTVGDRADWGPEQLMLLAAESSFMDSYLAAARDADLQILGYVSSAHLEIPDGSATAPRVTLRPCVVVASARDAEHAARILHIATGRSILARLLGDQFFVSIDVQLETAS